MVGVKGLYGRYSGEALVSGYWLPRILVPKLCLGTPSLEALLRDLEAELPPESFPSRAWEREAWERGAWCERRARLGNEGLGR